MDFDTKRQCQTQRCHPFGKPQRSISHFRGDHFHLPAGLYGCSRVSGGKSTFSAGGPPEVQHWKLVNSVTLKILEVLKVHRHWFVAEQVQCTDTHRLKSVELIKDIAQDFISL